VGAVRGRERDETCYSGGRESWKKESIAKNRENDKVCGLSVSIWTKGERRNPAQSCKAKHQCKREWVDHLLTTRSASCRGVGYRKKTGVGKKKVGTTKRVLARKKPIKGCKHQKQLEVVNWENLG